MAARCKLENDDAMRLRFRPLRHWPLALKLAVAVFVLALVPQLVVALVNADDVRSQLEERERQALQRRAGEAARRLEERVGRLRAYSELLATNPLIVDAVEDRIARPRRGTPAERHRKAVERARGWDARHDEVHRLLLSVRRANAWFQHAYLLDPSGLCISSSERETQPEMIGRVYDYRPYYRAPLADGDAYVTDVLKNVHSPGSAIFISAPVTRDNEVAGIIVVKIDTAALDDVVADLSARGGRTLFVDRFGVVVSDASAGRSRSADDAASVLFRPLAPLDRYRTLFEDTRRYGDPLHENHLERIAMPLELEGLWQKLRSGGTGAASFAFPAIEGGSESAMVGHSVVWASPGDPYGYLVVAYPTRQFRAPLEALTRTAMLRAVLVAAVVALVLGFLIKRMSRRVRRLADATRAVAGGNLELRLDDRYEDELGKLASAFDRMTAEFAETVDAAERQRAKAERARIEAERAHAAKHAFITKVGRQARTPLEQIETTVVLLRTLAEARDDATLLENVAAIEAASEDIRRVVEQMRTLSGTEEAQRECIALREFIEDVAESARPAAVLSSSTLELDIEGELGDAWIDRAKLRQILFELLGNAFKFTRQGQVQLIARRYEAHDEPVLVIRVSDTGIGMTRGQIERFEAERPTDAISGPAGTGLVVSRLAARAIGAQLRVESEPGQGATFTLQLPLRSHR